MKIWKRFAILALIAVFALSACGDDDTAGTDNDDNGNNFDLGEGDAGTDDAGTDNTGTDDAGGDDVTEHEDTNGGNGDEDVDLGPPPEEADCQADFDHDDACGGDVVGAWHKGEICTDFDIDDALEQANCMTAEVHLFEYELAEGSGTIEFTEDTYDRDLQIVIDADFYVPPECLDLGGFSFSCQDFSQGAEEFIGIKVDCQDANEQGAGGVVGCDCLVDNEILDRSNSGTYEADSDNGTLMLDGNTHQSYCVENQTVTIRDTDVGADIPFVEAYVSNP